MIEISGLTKKYRKKLAVDDVSFTVETGKVTGFLGPNGAGKSTTMRLMLGLDHGGGTTKFDGKKLQAHARPSEVAGILLEAKAFHPTRTARSHLRMLAAAGGHRWIERAGQRAAGGTARAHGGRLVCQLQTGHRGT